MIQYSHRFAARTAAALLLSAALIPTAADAEAFVDQSQLNGSEQLRAINSNLSLGQSFTVGADGYLAGVELSLTGTTPGIILKAKIVDATGGVLGSLRLGQAQMSPPDLGSAPEMLDPAQITATYLDFTGFAIPVTVGQELAILLETTAPSPAFAVRIALDSDSYQDGRIISNGSGSTGDLAFKTFVVSELELSEAVDQHQLNGFDQLSIVPTGASGQTFTAGADGLLEGIELILSGSTTPEPLLIEILDVTDGLEGAPVLGSTTLDGSEVVSGVQTLHRNEIRGNYIDLSDQQIIVVAGDQLAIRLSTEHVGSPFWSARRALQNLYDGGSFFSNGTFNGGIDLAFKTFVSDPLFGDDFETGDLSRWAEVVP